MSAAYPVVISDGHGRVLAKGRTANISEHGVFVVTSAGGALKAGGTIDLQISVPHATGSAKRRPGIRTVHRHCRIVRVQAVGHLLGIGVEFVSQSA